MAPGQTLPLEGPRSRPLTGDENQPLKPKSQRPGAQVALTVSSTGATASAEATSSGDHHLSTDDSGHLPTNTAPASGGCPKAHRQVLTPILATRTRTGPSQNTSTALAAYDVLGSRQRREDLDVAGPRAARPSPGWRTDSCTLSRKQQFAFPAWLEDASSAELEDAFLPRMPEEEAGRRPTRRQAPTWPALLPSKDDEDP
jgi:hypothetical protein